MIYFNKKVLILTFCSAGCSIQLFQVLSQFIQFPVRTEIIYDYPSKMIVPDFDIFIRNTNLLNLTEIYLKQPKKITQICKSFVQPSNATIETLEQFNDFCSKAFKSYEFGLSLGKILTVGDIEATNVEPLIPKVRVGDIIRSDLCSIERHFNSINTFLRVSCKENSKPIEKQLVRNIEADERFCIMHNIYNKFGVRFAHTNSSINPTIVSYNDIEREKGENVLTFLRYREITIESSEWPYQPNCRHYNKTEIFNECLRKKLFQLYPGTIHMEDVVRAGELAKDSKFEDLRTRLHSPVSQKRKECAELVKRPQCVEKTYQTQGKTFKEKGRGIGMICLESQVDFNIILKTYPKYTLTEILIYISSILGIWFGVSIYGRLMEGFVCPRIDEPIFQKVDVAQNVKRFPLDIQ
uniref:Uncharacterized protein n=1 Tax=Tetranychus urticae TaxID=32264 RepID=T1JZL9_TETUR